MKSRFAKTCFLFFLAGIAYAADTPGFRMQVIKVPLQPLDSVWPYWKDLNRDGLVDLLALAEVERKVFIYRQTPSGFAAASQSVEFPEGTAWFTVEDVNKHPGDEILFSTARGLAYYRQNEGVFEAIPQLLVEAEQVFNGDIQTVVFGRERYPDRFGDAIPVVFPDHAVLYKSNENYEFKPGRRINLEPTNSIDKNIWNSWSLGGKESSGIRIVTKAQDETKATREDPEETNAFIKKMTGQIKGRRRQGYCIVEEDINGDGQKDVTLVHLVQDVDVRSRLMIFL